MGEAKRTSATALFELYGPGGHRYALYEDGTAIGFPEGTVVVNRAMPLVSSLRARIKQFPASGIPDDQG